MLANTLHKNQVNNLTVSSIVRKNPQIKIIDERTGMDMEKPWKQLHDDILTRNDFSESDFKIVYSLNRKMINSL